MTEDFLQLQAQVLRNMTEGVSVTDESGYILYTNPAEDRLFGYEPGELAGQHVTIQNAYPPEENARRVEQVIEVLKASGSWTGEWLNRKKDGTVFYTFARISAATLGSRRFWICVQEDITEQRRARREREYIEQQLTRLVQVSQSLLADPISERVPGNILEVAQRFIEADAYAVWRLRSDGWTLMASSGLSPDYAGATPRPSGEELAGKQVLAVEDVEVPGVLQSRLGVYRREGIRALLVTPLRWSGEVNGTLVFYWRAPHRCGEAEKQVAEALGNLSAAACSAADAHLAERRLRAAAERAEARAAFLAKAGEILASSLEYSETLESIAALAVPDFADWCAVDVMESGKLRQVALKHAEPDKADAADLYNRLYPRGDDPFLQQVLGTGRPLLISQVSEPLLERAAPSLEQRDLLRSFGLVSIIGVPMIVRDVRLGVITFITSKSGRVFDSADLHTAEELARRAATAVDHARLYKAVRESEDRFRRAVLEAPAPIMIHATGGAILHLSRAWTELSGYPPEDPRTAEWVSRTFPPGTPVEQLCVRGREVEMVTSAGEIRSWIISTASIGELPDGSALLISAAMDITDRKRLEQARMHLAAIVESSEDAIVSKDLRGVITSWNRAAERLFGYPASEAVGRPITELIAIGREAEVAGILRKIELGQPVEHYETTRRRKNGEEIAVSLSVSPVRDSTGRIVGASKIARDITEQKRAQLALRETNEALRRSNSALEQFAYAAAHDLKEPLRMIGIYAQLLEKRYAGNLDQEARLFLSYLDQGARRMEDLVNDLLAYIQAGEGGEPAEVVDTQEAVQQAIALAQETTSEAGAVIRAAGLPVVRANRAQLVQVFENLISNALKYRKPGEAVAVDISAEDAGEMYIFTVRDNGIGIAPQYHERIFGLFKRLHREAYSGTGIGLPICERIVQKYGGRIWVESAEGEGAAFRFTLPKA